MSLTLDRWRGQPAPDPQAAQRAEADALTIAGHPEVPLLDWQTGNLMQMVTVCVECGSTHSIIMLVNDRWYCSKCRVEGNVDRNVKVFPIS